MAEEVGAAYVSLIPSARGFSRKAKRELEQAMRGVKDDAVTIEVKPEIDPVSGVLRTELQRQLKALAERVALELPVGPDTSGLRAKLQQQIDQIRTALSMQIPTEPGSAADYHRKLRELIDSIKVTQKVEQEIDRGRDTDSAFGSGRNNAQAAARGGSALGRLFVSAFGSTLLNPVIGIPAVILAAIGAPIVAALTAGATLAGGALALVMVGAFGLRADEQLKAALVGLGATVNKTLSDAAQPLKGPFLEAIGIVGQAIKDLGPTLKEVFKILGPSIPELARGFAGFLGQLKDTGALEAFAKVGGKALEQLAMALPDIGNALAQFMISMTKVGPEAVSAFGKLLRVTADIVRFVGDLIVFLVRLPQIFGAVTSAIGEFFELIGLGIMTAILALGGFQPAIDVVKESIADVGRFIADLWDKVVGKTSTTFDSIAGFARGLPAKITAAVGNLGSLLLEAGQHVVQGLINGMKSKLSALANMASLLAGTIRAFLPFSPAKEGPLSGSGNPFHSGQVIASDMAAGIRSQLPKAASAGEQLASAFGLGGPSMAFAGAASSSSLEASWAPGASGDPLLDGLRELIRFRYRGDPDAALRTV